MMIRSVILLLFCFYLTFIQKANGSRFFNTDEFINSLKLPHSNHQNGICKIESDCPEGFFCKNNDCIAKRSEGDSCLSSSDDECMCGKCILDTSTWSNICFSNSYCRNGGSTQYNSCETNSECPEDFFCDIFNGKVCTSKLLSGRLCNSNSMCFCGKCEKVSHKTRPNKPDITFNVCGSC
ncbi:unnamed protein product [Brachionus calyciflorus]|uniref:Uncharacterized protein n=1 Tax=Brachionus calyciflorus TaxID=104777 RepID=A0A814KG84_9BILA|nr:unnamed protein product [Brachionus calyciflorus]